MPEAVLAIDAGTTGIRAMVVGADGAVLTRAKEPCALRFPAPGLVEQDAEQLWKTVQSVIQRALKDTGLAPGDVAAIGIACQRSCCIVWERATGKPVAPLVSWQDLRGVERAAELQQLGYFVQPQLAAAKLESVVDAIPDGRARVDRGELAWGNVDSYLAARLTAGNAHLTDPSNACATGFYDIFGGDWMAPLIEAQRFPIEFFPKLVDTRGRLAETDAGVFGAAVPITAIAGDQQSAAIAQGCGAPGEGKVTFGTSATCNVNTGSQILAAPGAYPLVLKRVGDETTFCLEGMVLTAGAVFDWLAQGLGLIEDAAASEKVAAAVADTAGVRVLPALQGLGTPYMDPARTAEIRGLTRGASAGHVVRAALEGVAFRVREMVGAVYETTGLPRPDVLRADGGAAANNLLMQFQADALGIPVERMAPLEATAYGAALLAGQAIELWDESATSKLRKADRVFEPAWSSDERESRFAEWRQAFGLTPSG